ncbi:hypothetical protein COL922a_007346 [Colletotrichum nupharicola]|nr:hypothetical protein COL922a_007346 [Colletotrichum nupharicola]
MKFSLALLAAGLVAAQDFSGQPDCAIPCLRDAIPKVGCALTDTACQCASDKQEALVPVAAPCLLSACSSADLGKAQAAAAAACQKFLATASGSTKPTGSAASAASSAAGALSSAAASVSASASAAITSAASVASSAASVASSAASVAASASRNATASSTTLSGSRTPSASATGTGASATASAAGAAGQATAVVGGVAVAALFGIVAAL